MKSRTLEHRKSHPSKTRKTCAGAWLGIGLGVGIWLGAGGVVRAAEGSSQPAATAGRAAPAAVTAARSPVEGYPWSSVVGEVATVPAALAAIIERI